MSSLIKSFNCQHSLDFSKCILSKYKIFPTYPETTVSLLFIILFLGLFIKPVTAAIEPILYQHGVSLSYTRINQNTIAVGNITLQTANRVIIRTRLNKSQLATRFSKLYDIKEIASFVADRLFLASLPQNLCPIEYAATLTNQSQIVYAQPDLLQKNTKSHFYLDNAQYLNTSLVSIFSRTWQQTRGGGVVIAIIDDGFDLSHPELQDKKPLFAYDVDSRLLGAEPKGASDTHGNMVAGIIFSRHNGNDVEGIAPEANLIAIRQVNSWTSDIILAFTIAEMAGADIINCSWTIPFMPQPLAEVITNVSDNDVWILAAANNDRSSSLQNALATVDSVILIGSFHPIRKTAVTQQIQSGANLLAPTGYLTTTVDNKFCPFNGTSASTAYVSGAMALLLSMNRTLARNELFESLSQFNIQQETTKELLRLENTAQ